MTTYGQLDFNVILVDYCYDGGITVPTDYFTPTTMSYSVAYTAYTRTFDISQMTITAEATTYCTEPELKHTMYSNTPSDTATYTSYSSWSGTTDYPFTFDYSAQILTIETSDFSHVGTYELQVTYGHEWYKAYYSTLGTYEFLTVTILDPCVSAELTIPD